MTKLFITAYSRIQAGQRGATMAEYGLMLALIAVVCILAVTAIGTNLNATFNSIANSIGVAN